MSNYFLPLLIKNMIEEYQKMNREKRYGIVNYDKFTPTEETIKFGEVKKNSSYKNVRMTYNDKTLMLKTPNLRSISNESYYQEKLTLSFNIRTVKGKAFYDSMVNLENLVAKEAYKNRVEWKLGSSYINSYFMTEREVRDLMIPIIRENKEKTYPPTFNVNLNIRNNEETGKFQAIISEVYDQNGKKIIQLNNRTFNTGTYCRILMYTHGVWVLSGSCFGISFHIKQVKVYPRLEDPKNQIGFCLIDD